MQDLFTLQIVVESENAMKFKTGAFFFSFWNRHPKVIKKEVLDFIYQIWFCGIIIINVS